MAVKRAEPASVPQGYVTLPRAVLLDLSLPDGCVRLYGLLLHYAWQTGKCWPGQARMALDLGVTDRTIRSRLSALEAAGHVSVERDGDGRPATIFLQTGSQHPQVDQKPEEKRLHFLDDRPEEPLRSAVPTWAQEMAQRVHAGEMTPSELARAIREAKDGENG